MKVWLRGIFLALTAFCLGYTSGMLYMGFIASIAVIIVTFLNEFSRMDVAKRPIYRKWVAYMGIIPCAIWWIITPAVDYGVSPYLVYIPGWYLFYLAFLQFRSIGRGGFESFVIFDGVASLLASTYQAPRFVVLIALFALILCVISIVRRGVPIYKFVLFLLLFAMLSCSTFMGFRYWKEHRKFHHSKISQEYFFKNRMMGFDPVVSLGSFRSNYESRYNSEVVLRVWDTLSPNYIKAAVYEKYVAGIWKLPSEASKILYPSRYQVDYAVFEIKDSIASLGKLDSGLKRVWVQSNLNNFGFFFAANGSVGVALKNDDSLSYYYGGVFKGTEKHHYDWYYFINEKNPSVNEDSLFEYNKYRDLLITEKYKGFLDTVITEMNLVYDTMKGEQDLIQQINDYFVLNFKYALHVPGISSKHTYGKDDPLFVFYRAKKGYCEYYATLATLILRKMGVKARYVTGFYRGERLRGLPYVIFRRYHAHAWVEAFVDGKWVPFDPTPPTAMIVEKQFSFLDSKIENIRGKWFYFIHLLKEGEWRKTVDSWQNITQRFVKLPYLYILLSGIIILLFFLRFVQRRRGKNLCDSLYHANRVAYWSKKLARLERQLSYKGFVRNSGETVGKFILRIQKKNNSDKVKLLVDGLKEYEKERWKY